MGIPAYLTCLLRYLCAGQEATVGTRHGAMAWFQLGKGIYHSVYCHPAYLTDMQSTSCELLGWMKHRLDSRLTGEISVTSDMQMTPFLWMVSSRTKEPLDESEGGEEKIGLKLNIQKSKIMASGPITSWQIGETMETVKDLIFLGSKITADGDCSHEIKRHLLLGRKAITNLKKWESEVAQSCPTLCDPMDCSLPGSSVHGIFQARVLEWVAVSFSRRSSQPRDWTRVSCIAGKHFTIWATI